jgi:hypothetical protein
MFYLGITGNDDDACCLHHRRPDDGGSWHLWNVGKLLPDYMVLQPRRQSCSAPILQKGCENWTLSRADKRRIETAESKFLREAAGHALQDEISNLTIRN